MKIETLVRIVDLLYERNDCFSYNIQYCTDGKIIKLLSDKFAVRTVPFEFLNSDLLTIVESKRKFLCLLIEMIGRPNHSVDAKNNDIYLSKEYHFEKKPESLFEIFEKLTPLFWKVRENNLPINFTMEYKNSKTKYLDINRKYSNIKSLEKDERSETLKILDADWTIDKTESVDMYTVVLDSALDFIIDELAECLENND